MKKYIPIEYAHRLKKKYTNNHNSVPSLFNMVVLKIY